MSTGRRVGPLRGALFVGALGVVFGDIGTSPIYTLQTVFAPTDPHPVPPTPENILGVVSLIFWSATIIVTVTYVLLAMRVDNDGEGGIMALIALLRRRAGQGRSRLAAGLVVLGVLGAALFLGDSMITPAISILSAVEGMEVVDADLERFVIPITLVIVLVLFLAQRFGTAKVGRLFGPVMVGWFAALAVTGILGITHDPGILRAISPTYAIGFVVDHFDIAFFALASVVLAVTGAEALYADMGHFGRRPISLAWLFVVFPALALNYLGQGALGLADPANLSAPFFLMIPTWALIPMVVLATVATVIASQAVITGAFSVAAQATQLGYLPRLRLVHTSRSTYGQIYVPWINWVLLASVALLILAFRSSAALAFAYGMAVTGTITITTLLLFYVGRQRWSVPRWVVLAGLLPLLTVDLMFLAANLTKFVHGAWLPVVIAAVAFTVMLTWHRGVQLTSARRQHLEGPLRPFVERLRSGARVATVPGTAVFLNRDTETAPLALRANVDYNHVRHERVLIVSVMVLTSPRAPADQRVVIGDLGASQDGITRLTLNFGYTETSDVPAVLARITPEQLAGVGELADATYFLSRMELLVGDGPGMARWRKRLFVATSHLTAEQTQQFWLPADRVVVMGFRVAI